LNVHLTSEFRYGLEQLDMLDQESPDSSGLVLKNEYPENFHQRLFLEKTRKYKVDAVYFRRFENGRVPIPQIYI